MATFHNASTGVTVTVTPEHPSFASIARDPAWQDTAAKEAPKKAARKKVSDD